MASRHRHHHPCSHHHNQIPLPPMPPRCCTFQDSPPYCTHPSPPPPPPPQDNLLHLLASYLQTHQQETNFPNKTCSCSHKNAPREHDQDQVVLSRLLRKIDNLESSLNKFESFHGQRRDKYSTVRDSAARVIQTHFRSYLVRRSISFRHLKELAIIKSTFLSLKSSVSGRPIFNFKAVSRKATDLLLQLDSIQGRVDPMIRSSKRSLSRDLVRFLQYVDDCVVRRYGGYISKSTVYVGGHSKRPQGGVGVVAEEKLRSRMGKVFVTCDEDEELDSATDDSVDKRSKFRTRAHVVKHDVTSSVEDEDDSVDSDEEETFVVCRGEDKKRGLKGGKMVVVKGSGGKRRVRFDEDGNVYKVYGDTSESSISGEGSDGSGDKKGCENEVVEIKNVPKGNEEEETQSESEASSSDGSEGDNTGSNEQMKSEIQVQKGSLMFSPPLPLKMEP